MIVLDLEWNSGRYGNKLDEILQIGAVKLSRQGRIEDTFCAYIRPKAHRTYSPAAALLPELEQSLRSQTQFPAAAESFLRWCGQEERFATWGRGDFRTLRQNLTYWKLDTPLPETALDLQAAFGAAVGTSSSLSLGWAIEYCAIPQSFCFHNALHDSMYTALVATHIPPKLLEGCVYPTMSAPGQVPAGRRTGRGAPKRTSSLPPRPGGWFGPFESRRKLLLGRASRRAVCPACRMKQYVGEWYWTSEDICYARFSCPDHGRYLLRLETAQDKQGQLWGWTQVLEDSGENRSRYRQAKLGQSLRCSAGAGTRRRRSAWRRRKKEKKGPERR